MPVLSMFYGIIIRMQSEKGGEKVFSYTNLIGIQMNYTEDWQPSVEELRTVGIPGYCNNNDITENKLRTEQNYYLRAEY